jgi:hypothetical protein
MNHHLDMEEEDVKDDESDEEGIFDNAHEIYCLCLSLREGIPLLRLDQLSKILLVDPLICGARTIPLKLLSEL